MIFIELSILLLVQVFGQHFLVETENDNNHFLIKTNKTLLDQVKPDTENEADSKSKYLLCKNKYLWSVS